MSLSHRNLLAGVLFALTAITMAHGAEPTAAETKMDQRLAELRTSPLELYAFLYRMPKGADLHNHVSGAVYAEGFLRAAVDEHLCVVVDTLALTAPGAGGVCPVGQVAAAAVETDNNLRNALIDSFSMRNFVAGKQSGHDHFFATFDKFGAVDSGALIAEVAERASDQNESYLELMALSGGGPIANLGKTVGLTADFDATRKKLEAAGLPKLVGDLKARIDQMESVRKTKLGCTRTPAPPACRLQVHYVYQVLREFPKEQTFAQVMGGFALAALDPSRVVAVNFVQAEDGYTSMTDYHLQMTMVEYAKRIYPNVHVTLHAGELAPGLVAPDGLRFHIREAVELGHAERIGHGVDIMYENEPLALLAEMRDRHVAVEINLTSNDVILGVRGADHPFPVYRKNGVPVMLSTDDEGVSRSQLTEEFQRAVLTYNLSYTELKELVRNSIEYSFAPGASYWKDRKYVTPAAPCTGGEKTAACRDYLNTNEKARLGADLEDRFAAFEKN